MGLGQNDANFRSAERAYLEPPDERGPWECPTCGEKDNYDEVCGNRDCLEDEPNEEDYAEDPDDARDRMLEARWESD